MAEADVLARLQDIDLPAPIGWWPLALGWYLLAALLLISLGVFAFYYRRRRLQGLPKRQGLHLLESYYQEYQRQKTSPLTSMKISELLRRVSLVYFPREEVAGLHGEAWLSFLKSKVRNVDCVGLDKSLLELPYQPAKDYDLEPLFAFAKEWIKQRGKPC